MATAGFYLRSRGKISGPFDLTTLQKLVKRGTLSRMHEVSSDRMTWSHASEFSDLFPSHMPAAHVTEVAAHVQAVETAVQSPSVVFYYAKDGVTVGPIPLSVLQSLAQTGTLGSNDVCWQDGAQVAIRAAEVPALASIFSKIGDRAGVGQVTEGISEIDRQRNARILETILPVCQVAGIVVGAALLLLLNLPLLRDSTNGTTVWWWDILRVPDAGAASIVCFFILFSGLASGIVGATTRGLVRAWVFNGIAILSLLLCLSIMISQPSMNADAIFGLLALYLTPALVGVSWFRSKAPRYKIGSIFQGIFGGTLLFVSIVSAILSVVEQPPPGVRDFLQGTVTSQWVLFARILVVIGIVTNITAAILGLVGLKRSFTRGANVATIVCGITSVIVMFLAVMIGVAGLMGTNGENLISPFTMGMFVFLCFRVCAGFCVFLALLVFGMLELFATSCLESSAT
jgi:hypothetical protein